MLRPWRAVSAVMLIAGVSAAALSAQTPSAAPPEVMTLRAGDELRLRVWPDSSLGGQFAVEENGAVRLPVVGEIRVTGRSLADLRSELRGRYEQAMKAPVVYVLPLFRVSVLGAVNRPGLLQVDPTMSLFDVIALAGGFAQNAKTTDVRVVRDGKVLPVNAKVAMETGTVPAGLQLQSGDQIVVGQKSGGPSGILVLQLLSLAITLANILTR